MKINNLSGNHSLYVKPRVSHRCPEYWGGNHFRGGGSMTNNRFPTRTYRISEKSIFKRASRELLQDCSRQEHASQISLYCCAPFADNAGKKGERVGMANSFRTRKTFDPRFSGIPGQMFWTNIVSFQAKSWLSKER